MFAKRILPIIIVVLALFAGITIYYWGETNGYSKVKSFHKNNLQDLKEALDSKIYYLDSQGVNEITLGSTIRPAYKWVARVGYEEMQTIAYFAINENNVYFSKQEADSVYCYLLRKKADSLCGAK